MNTIELKALLDVATHLSTFRKKIVYPGFPFLTAPLVVVWLILWQLGGSVALNSVDSVSGLQLESAVSSAEGVTETAGTFVFIPRTAERFILPNADQALRRAWVAAPIDRLFMNDGALQMEHDYLSINGVLVGVDYPLAIFLEGVHQEEMILEGEKDPVPLPSLRLESTESVWVALGSLLAALFGIGVAAGFLKDGIEVPQQDHGSYV